MIAVEHEQCQWIGPEQQDAPFVYKCQCKPLAGRAYCEEHFLQVYQSGTALRKRKKDIRVANAVWDLESAFNEAVEELEEEGFDFR